MSSKILPLFMLFSALLLLWIGVPRFLAELMLVPGTPIYERISSGETVTDEELDVLQQSREQSIGFVDKPRSYTDLGLVYILRAHRTTDAAEKKAFALKAIEQLETGLALAPVATFAWARLASACLIAGPEHSEKAVKAWRTSVALANFEPFIFLSRNHIGINLYKDLSEEDRQTLRDQVELTYNWNRGKLRRYARDNGLVEWIAFLLYAQPEKAQWISAK
ncbi:MAG: hypothetical protein JKY34_11455 [Kordiimonadaceae bacterium]|nr:hypothetical protein [Kordiimonadaceae bacterium]